MLVLCMILSTALLAKTLKTVLKVQGNCGQCEERIENVAYKIGVKSADWNKETEELVLHYNPRKVNLDTLIDAILRSGHDVGDQKATQEAYDTLPNCCKFRDGSCNH